MSNSTDFTTLPKPLQGIVLDYYVDLFPTTELISHHMDLPTTWPEVGFIWSAVTRAFGNALSLGEILKLKEHVDGRLQKFAKTTFAVRSNLGQGGAPIIKMSIVLTSEVARQASHLNNAVDDIFAVLQRLDLISHESNEQLTMLFREKVTVACRSSFGEEVVVLEQNQVHCTVGQPIS